MTDWSQAPEWAQWCVTTRNGLGRFTEYEPILTDDGDGFGEFWAFDDFEREVRGRMARAKGPTWPGSDEPDWRQSKRRRPK